MLRIVGVKVKKKFGPFLDLCVSSLRRGHANLLCIVPILSDVPEGTVGYYSIDNIKRDIETKSNDVGQDVAERHLITHPTRNYDKTASVDTSKTRLVGKCAYMYSQLNYLFIIN